MIILGIHAGFRPTTHEAGAALIIDGKLLAVYEEERFNRIKNSPGTFPLRSIKKILEDYSITISDIDIVATAGVTMKDSLLENSISECFYNWFGKKPEKLLFYHHEDCHLHCASLLKTTNVAHVISIDACGDGVSGASALLDENNNLLNKKYISKANSLGIVYESIVSYLGFKAQEDEYKVMGLSAYGCSDMYKGSELITRHHDFPGYRINGSVGAKTVYSNYMPLYSDSTLSKLYHITDRTPFLLNDKLIKDISAHLQEEYEKGLQFFIEYLLDTEGTLNKDKQFLFAGGCALNCLANMKIVEATGIDLKVFPAASDRGIAVGAAVAAAKDTGCLEVSWSGKPDMGSHIGTADEIDFILKTSKIHYTSIDNLYRDIASEIIAGKIIGFAHGRSEFGPRALGYRSILCDAELNDAKELLNRSIKFRESFRPFAPVCHFSVANEYFTSLSDMRYMNITCRAHDKTAQKTPGAVHVDGTCRLQIPEPGTPFDQICSELLALGHSSIILNTSFNLKDQPIVENARDAIGTFYQSGLDILYLGNRKIVKNYGANS